MKRWVRVVLIVIVALLVVLLVGPFLIPVPPLEDTVPPEQLADPDSHFIDINGLQVHYKIVGLGEPAGIPGAAPGRKLGSRPGGGRFSGQAALRLIRAIRDQSLRVWQKCPVLKKEQNNG